MRLLIDENVPDSVARFLRGRGHDVDLVRDSLGQMTPDDFVAWVADDLHAIVVTMDKDFNGLVSRTPKLGRRRFHALGRIALRCREARRWAAFKISLKRSSGSTTDCKCAMTPGSSWKSPAPAIESCAKPPAFANWRLPNPWCLGGARYPPGSLFRLWG